MKIDRDKYMTEDELKRLLQAARTRFSPTRGRARGGPGLHPHAPRDYALLAFDALTGLRVHELVGVRVGDLRGVVGETRDERPARVRVRRAKRKTRDGGPVWDELPLPETARAALVDYLRTLPAEEREPHSRVFPVSKRQVIRIFRYYAKRAGLSSRLTPHSLRHTRGTLTYQKYRDLKLVQGALGHASLKTTEIYLHTVDGDKKLAALDIGDTEEGNDAADQGRAEEDESR